MKLRSRLTGTVLIGTLTMFGLAACGSDDSNDDSSNSDSSSDTSEDTESEDTSSDEGDGDKPSKDEVIAGYSQLITDIVGTELPEDILTSVVTCFVDEVYDDASPETLQAIADGDQAGINPNDTQLFTDATTACQSAITGG